MASIDDLFTEGFDAWARATGRAYVDYTAGNSDAVLRGLEPDAVGAAAPKDSDLVIETEMLRADALAWNGDVEGARRAVDRGEAAVAAEHHREMFWHGRLAMVGARVEADSAVAAMASRSIGAIEKARSARGRDRCGVGNRRRAARPVKSAPRRVHDGDRCRSRPLAARRRRRPCAPRGRSLRKDRVAVLRDVLPLARGGGDVERR